MMSACPILGIKDAFSGRARSMDARRPAKEANRWRSSIPFPTKCFGDCRACSAVGNSARSSRPARTTTSRTPVLPRTARRSTRSTQARRWRRLPTWRRHCIWRLTPEPEPVDVGHSNAPQRARGGRRPPPSRRAEPSPLQPNSAAVWHPRVARDRDCRRKAGRVVRPRE
jgi:hypothetical protein